MPGMTTFAIHHIQTLGRWMTIVECNIDQGMSSKGGGVRCSLSQSRITSNGRVERTPEMFWSFIFRLAATHMNYGEDLLVGSKGCHNLNSEYREIKETLTRMGVSPREPSIPATSRDGIGVKGPQRMSTRCKERHQCIYSSQNPVGPFTVASELMTGRRVIRSYSCFTPCAKSVRRPSPEPSARAKPMPRLFPRKSTLEG